MKAAIRPASPPPKTLISRYLDMSVFGGVLAGLMAAFIYNRFQHTKLPSMFSFFGGEKFPITMIVLVTIPDSSPQKNENMLDGSVGENGLKRKAPSGRASTPPKTLISRSGFKMPSPSFNTVIAKYPVSAGIPLSFERAKPALPVQKIKGFLR